MTAQFLVIRTWLQIKGFKILQTNAKGLPTVRSDHLGGVPGLEPAARRVIDRVGTRYLAQLLADVHVLERLAADSRPGSPGDRDRRSASARRGAADRTVRRGPSLMPPFAHQARDRERSD